MSNYGAGLNVSGAGLRTGDELRIPFGGFTLENGARQRLTIGTEWGRRGRLWMELAGEVCGVSDEVVRYGIAFRGGLGLA